MSGTATDRLLRVEHVMGTVVSIDVRGADIPDAAIDAAIGSLHEADRRFSPYRHDSEVSRLARGELALADCADDLRAILDACEGLRLSSAGAFDIAYAGGLDPSGYVKGWAVDRAAEHLVSAGARDLAINAGGDALLRGAPEPGRQWRVGIRHPDLVDSTAAVIGVGDGAVATSGLYERGAHILDPATGRPPTELLSITVVAPTLAQADALATACFVMGERGIAWVLTHPGSEVLAITAARRLRTSRGISLLS